MTIPKILKQNHPIRIWPVATASEICFGTNTDEGEHRDYRHAHCTVTDDANHSLPPKMPCENRRKGPSELKWLSLLSRSLYLFLFLLLRGWNSVKHALVLTWDGYGNMFSYPRQLFSVKSFTGGLIQTGGREEMLKLVKSQMYQNTAVQVL